MASVMYSGEGSSRQRLSYPKLFTGDDWVETNADHALKDEDSEVADTLFRCQRLRDPDQLLPRPRHAQHDRAQYQEETGIAAHTSGFDTALAANRLSLKDCSKITGVPVAGLQKAADWAYAPKADGTRKRTMHGAPRRALRGQHRSLPPSGGGS
jgi:hypothetical protein